MKEMANRVVPIDGSVNLRELGGIPTADGRTIKSHQILRAGTLSGVTRKGQQQLWDYGVRVVIDFRSQSEVDSTPDQLPAQIAYNHDPVYSMTAGDNAGVFAKIKAFFHGQSQPPKDSFEYAPGLAGLYQQIILDPFSQRAYAFMFQQLLTHTTANQSVLFHCAAGKDRTGIGAALIEKALGVSQAVAVQDYLLTNLVLGGMSDDEIAHYLQDPQADSQITKMNMMMGEETNIPAVYSAIDEVYGSFVDFWETGLGFSQKDLTDLQSHYLE
ncbi:protein tyrosine phosphatase [Schleiferilactobacillus perolens DSM 12744]|uniref:Protein tyrosine phosphatase n=2 Tax=Schleiferilactobacillus perolens TaxID=100468 RepID=A0A0R1N8M4_9LACO|nr:protein tyrosine phosphatase [Schleiferilactobacillus perolens DSM 12744]